MLMKTLLSLVLVLVSGIAIAKDYKVDPDHSSIEFKIKHMTSKVSGAFREFSGEFVYDEAKPEAFKLNATIKADSIDTRNAKRDEHLKSPDFFDTKKFPTLTYAGKSAKKIADKKYKVEGDLSMHGVTKPVSLDVEVTEEAVNPWGLKVTGGTATGKLMRKDFGLIWNKALDHGGFVLGEEVEITLNLEVVEKKAEAPAAPKAAEKPAKGPAKKK